MCVVTLIIFLDSSLRESDLCSSVRTFCLGYNFLIGSLGLNLVLANIFSYLLA